MTEKMYLDAEVTLSGGNDGHDIEGGGGGVEIIGGFEKIWEEHPY